VFGGRDQPPAAYFKEASYGSAKLASLSNRSRGRGSTITNADKKDLCKLVIHALRNPIFLINNTFNETFLPLKRVSDLGDGGLIGQEVVL
jgi:hypothetical protein